MAYALMSRNLMMGEDLMADLCDRFSLEDVAGIMLISLERLIWFDTDAFTWAIANLIPGDVIQEIRRIISVTVGMRLIDQGLIPGQDFSVNSMGNLLLNSKAKPNFLGS